MKQFFKALSVLSVLIMISSCSDDIDPIRNLDMKELTDVAKDGGYVDNIYSDAGDQTEEPFKNADDEKYSGKKVSSISLYGPEISFSPGTDGTYSDTAYIITVDFGDGIYGRYGWKRAGKLIISVEGRFLKTGSKRTINFENYYVNDNKVEGYHKITNLGFDSLDMAYKYNIKVENGLITKRDGNTISYSSERIRKWIAGYETMLDWTDDIYLISGNYTGVSTKNVDFSAEITSDVKFYTNCKFIQDGVVLYEIGDNPNIIIDYGYGNDSDCDANASMTINGNTFPYTMIGY